MRKCCVSDTLNNSRSSRLRSSFWSWCVSFCLRRATNLPILVGFKKSATLQKPNPRDQERIPSMRKPTSHPKKNFRFNGTVRDWSFSYTSNLWENMFDSRRYTEFSPTLISKLQSPQHKIWVLEQPHSTMQCCISHMAIFSVITRVMNVRNQTNQTFVTNTCPFCGCSYQFVYGPWNVGSTNSFQTKTSENNLRPDSWPSSHRFQFFLFEMMVVKTWYGDFIQLHNLYICQFAIPSTQFLRITFHVTRRNDCFRVRFAPNQKAFQLLRRRRRDSNISLYSSRILSFSNFFHIGWKFAPFQTILMSFTNADKNRTCFRCTNKHSQFGTVPQPNSQ